MAVLDSESRVQLLGDWMRTNTEALGITKPDLRAAVSALDVFFDTNATAINNAIPQPARSSLSVAQKAKLITYVIMKRYG